MKIGIFGVELTSINYGCAALGLTQLQILEKIILDNNMKDNEYYIFSNDNLAKVDNLKEQLNIKSNVCIKKLINFRSGIKGFKYISDEIKKCDFIIDLTFGDSFSDIYGFKNYILYTLPKLITLHNKKDLLIAPQTIGPYKNIFAKVISKKVLKKSTYLCVRDENSLEFAKKLSKRDDIVVTSDLAMELPYTKTKLPGDKVKIGINVSELLWENSNKENKDKFGIIIDYKQLVENIITKFSDDKYEVHLITHVYSKDSTKGEFILAQKIHEIFPYTILAPKFDTPIDAKSYMSGLNLFFGARMHATIGAFSAGVPVIPISYSRKFEGLYGALGYNYGINLRDTTIEETMKHIDYCLNNYDKMENDRKLAFEEALKRNKNYHELLENIIK